MGAPATGGYHTNEHLVLEVMGAKGASAPDCPTFDAVRLHYELPNACTFRQAFNACWHGSRDWRQFDLETLRDSHPAFQHLQLPERVQDALEREAIAEEAERVSGEHDFQVESFEADLPPLEILEREPPRQSRRRRKGRTGRCKGSHNACGRSELAKRYRAAKRAYHQAGEQLRWAGIRGDLI